FGTSQSVASGHVVFSTTAGGRDTAAIVSAADWTNLLIVTTVPAGVPVGRDTLLVETSGGTRAPIIFTVVAKVAFSPSTVSWTATTALPVGLSGHAVAAATLPGATPTSVVYVAGGADSTNVPRDSVLYATVSSSGTVGAWTKTTVLPAPVAFAAAVVATPTNSAVTGASYLYVIGGGSTAGGEARAGGGPRPPLAAPTGSGRGRQARRRGAPRPPQRRRYGQRLEHDDRIARAGAFRPSGDFQQQRL